MGTSPRFIARLVLAGLATAGVAGACSNTGGNTGGQQKAATWSPGQVYVTPESPNARGFLDRRGLIHAHSIYSHDACDGQPVDDAGMRNMPCLEDFRRDLCTAAHDFVFLTDHGTLFNDTEYPDALLYDAARGDVLLTEDGLPTANRAACPDGRSSIIVAGSENAFMPVGMKSHVAATPAERGPIMGGMNQANIDVLKQRDAVILVAHTEEWTVEQLTTFGLDGFEMFNLHASTFQNFTGALVLLEDLLAGAPGMIHPDLTLTAVISEDPRYLATWGSVLASGARRVTTMGTDCHRNTFQQKLADNERVDSYRRMMIAFSNHLLVRPAADGTVSRAELVEALRAQRLYGVFEIYGYAQGFDFTAAQGGTTHEMGEEVTLATGPVTLNAAMPSVLGLDPDGPAPELTLRILKAREGGWDVVASGSTDVVHTVTEPGAYRAEVRMRARHLHAWLGYDKDILAEQDRPWVYSNAIYVR